MRWNSLRSPLWRAAAGLALAALVGAPSALADKIATAGAANTTSLRTPPGAGLRVIEIGAQIVQNEKIETSPSGSVQLLFIDKTTLNIGPNSKLVIDKFVFNPATTRGEMALSLSTGVLRVVGGLATHSGGATISTPVATVGIRGGIVTVSHSKAKGTRAILGYGIMTVTSRCDERATAAVPQAACTVTVTRPGFMVDTASADSPPSAPLLATADQIDALNYLLTSKGRQTGGASVLPDDRQAEGYDVGTPNSTAPALAASRPTTRGSNLSAIYVAAATKQIAQQAIQITAARTTAATVTPSPPSAPPAAYAILTRSPYGTSSGASAAPYLTGAFAGQGGFTVSPILGYQAASTGTAAAVSNQFQAGLGVTGQGPTQSTTIFVMTSEIAKAPGIGSTQAGGFDALTGRSGPGWAYGAGNVGSAAPASAPNTVLTTATGLPTGNYSLYNNSVNLLAGTVVAGHSSDSLEGNYTFSPVSLGSAAYLASNHPNLTLQGYIGGLAQSLVYNSTGNSAKFSAPYIVTNATGKPGDVIIYLPGNASGMGAVFNVAGLDPPSSGYNSASYQFGGYRPSDPTNTAGLDTTRGAYVDPTDFAARATAIYANGADIPTTTRNGAALSGTGDFADSILVTANSVGANTSAFLTSISSRTVTPCACQYTQWGFWSSSTGQVLNNGATAYADMPPNPMFWVAGVPTAAASLPATGTATYTGHAIADINNNGSYYIASGSFTNTVNFGSRTGAVAINAVDGANYAGTVNLTPASTLFAGNLPGSVAGRVATINGSFFQGGAANSTPLYGEMGGALSITGANYIGSGIFLGRKP